MLYSVFDNLMKVLFIGFWVFMIWWLRSRSDWLKLQVLCSQYRQPVSPFKSIYWIRVGNQTMRSSCSIATLPNDEGGIALQASFFLRLLLGYRTLYLPSCVFRHKSSSLYEVKIGELVVELDMPGFTLK